MTGKAPLRSHARLFAAVLALCAPVLWTAPARAAFPGGNGQIVFSGDGVCHGECQLNLFLVDADGSGLDQITDSQNPDYADPAWSPDGTKLAFARSDGGIWVMNGDGSAAESLTAPADDHQPSWSPDGKRIAFTRVQSPSHSAAAAIYVTSADGSSAPAALTDDRSDTGEPAWSPDGTRIAFSSDRAGNLDVYVMKADGSGVTRVTDDPGDDGSPAWSADGKKIAFVSDRSGNPDIYSMSSDGSDVRRLTDGREDLDPAWAPDGTKIAFVSTRDGGGDVYVMDADGTSVARVTRLGTLTSHPDWQPLVQQPTPARTATPRPGATVKPASSPRITQITNTRRAAGTAKPSPTVGPTPVPTSSAEAPAPVPAPRPTPSVLARSFRPPQENRGSRGGLVALGVAGLLGVLLAHYSTRAR